MMDQERRKSPRVAQRLTLALTQDDGECVVETMNISASGAYCTMDRFIAPMSKLKVHFELPDGARQVLNIVPDQPSSIHATAQSFHGGTHP